MSARDSESGSSSYKGGSRSAGGLGNGGIGGGRGGGGNFGGGMGGGAGRIGGIGSRTGLTTGTKMVGTPGRDGLSATGRPGGRAKNPGAWGWKVRGERASQPGVVNVRPKVPGLLDEPVQVAGVNPVPVYGEPEIENPLVDVQPGLPKLSEMPIPGMPRQQLNYTFGPRMLSRAQFAQPIAPSGYGFNNPRMDLGYYSTVRNDGLTDPRLGFSGNSHLANYGGSNFASKSNKGY